MALHTVVTRSEVMLVLAVNVKNNKMLFSFSADDCVSCFN